MEDYHDAATRHFSDGDLLQQQVPQRLANASHLYGLAGECALKAIMAGKSGAGKVKHAHLPNILEEFEIHSIAKGNPSLVTRVKKCAVGLNQWRIDERYHNRSSAAFTVGRIQSEHDAAKRLIGLLHLWEKGAA